MVAFSMRMPRMSSHSVPPCPHHNVTTPENSRPPHDHERTPNAYHLAGTWYQTRACACLGHVCVRLVPLCSLCCELVFRLSEGAILKMFMDTSPLAMRVCCVDMPSLRLCECLSYSTAVWHRCICLVYRCTMPLCTRVALLCASA